MQKDQYLAIIYFMALLLGSPFFAIAQKFQIQGAIYDSMNKPISNTVVIASNTENENIILAYKISDINGHYEFIIKNEIKLDSIWLIVRNISYETIRLKVPLKTTNKNFKLNFKIQQLEQVFVKNQKKVEVKGDTITYSVSNIKAEKDYTIEEVINRIPGVTINENGQIKYLDKPISHLYINGADLLEGRYSIATQGIPADAVKEIDIIKNHNNDRIDIGRTESNNIAFNLKIKKDAGLFFGSAKAGVGAPFLTGKIDVTPIYFKNQIQNIGSIKFNNTGKSLRDIGDDITMGNVNFENLKLEDIQIIKPPNVNGLVLTSKYWLDNESFAITEDGLHKINPTNLTKWNVNYSNELSKIENNSMTEFLTNTSTTSMVNKSRNQLRTQKFNAGFNHEINKSNLYLKNNTNYRFAQNKGFESVDLNDNKIESAYQDNDFQFSNVTNFKTLLGNDNIIQGGILAEFEQNSEKLNVVPPVFQNLIPTSASSIGTLQNVEVKKLNIGTYAEYDFRLLKSDWNIRQNLSYNNFNFKSNLSQIPNFTEQGFPFASKFDFQKISTTTRINCKFNLGKIKFSGGLSAISYIINTKENNILNLDLKDSFMFFQPNLSAIYKINSKLNLGITYSKNSAISKFSDLYPPVILTSYNSLVQNPFFINTINTTTFSPYLNYNNVLDSFFFSVNGTLNNSNSSVTFSNELNNEGFIITEVIKKSNTAKNYGFSTSIKKVLFGALRTDLSYSYNLIENQFFFNNQFINAFNYRNSINFELIWDKGDWFSFEYNAKLNFGTSQFSDSKINNSTVFQSATLDFYTSESTRINFDIESSRTAVSTNNSINYNTLFSASFYYKISKKMNFNSALLNIFDTPFFTTTNGMSNFVNANQFTLRKRQFTVGFTYSL